VLRHAQGVLDMHPNWQAWAGEVQAVLREAHTVVEQAKARPEAQLDPALLASEQALKSPKLLQKVSGNWHTTTILARFCRVRSYLISARNHGLRAIDAIHAALTGKPGCPYPRLRDSAHLAIPWNRRDSVE
jgi:hypothetical protein